MEKLVCKDRRRRQTQDFRNIRKFLQRCQLPQRSFPPPAKNIKNFSKIYFLKKRWSFGPLVAMWEIHLRSSKSKKRKKDKYLRLRFAMYIQIMLQVKAGLSIIFRPFQAMLDYALDNKVRSSSMFAKTIFGKILPESRRWKDFSLHSIKIIVTFLFMCLKITFDDDDGGGNDCLASEGECIEGSTVMIINVHSVILHVSNYFQ